MMKMKAWLVSKLAQPMQKLSASSSAMNRAAYLAASAFSSASSSSCSADRETWPKPSPGAAGLYLAISASHGFYPTFRR